MTGIKRCDLCGNPVLPGDLIYTAVQPGKHRHARCNQEKRDEAKKKLDASLARLKGLASELRSRQ